MPRLKASLRRWLLLGVMLGCVSRAESAQCEAMVEHIVELSRAAHKGRAAELAGEVASERRQAVLDRCLADGTVGEVECVLAADSLEAIQQCAP